MKPLHVAGAALALLLAAQACPAHAHPRHDTGLIAYVSDRDTTDPNAIIDEIYGLDPQTRKVHRLTYDAPGVERWPTISPDGRSLAWVRWVIDEEGAPRRDLSEIYRCDLRFGAGIWSCHNPRRIVGPVQENAITWTPDSRRILYASPVTNADFDADIYAVDVRSRQATNLTHEAVVDGTQVQNSQPTVSPNGRYFVYSRGSTGPTAADLYRRNIDGSNPVQLTAAPGNDIAADYSPDGKRLVFHSTRDSDADIYIMKASVEGPGNPAVNLTNGLRSKVDVTKPSQERIPSFSPEGRHIAFCRFTDQVNGFTDGEIYRMRADGSHIRNLTDNNPTDPAALSVGDIQPDWGPRPTRGPRH